MSKLPDSQVEGTTRFSPLSTTSYRYVISLKSDQMNIWLEDRSSRKQWQTGLLNKVSYVSAADLFVDSSATDYMLLFKKCMDHNLWWGRDFDRKLVPQNGNKLKLEMILTIRFLSSTRRIKNIFELKPIAVDRIDILESKLKDQQEELEQLRAKTNSDTTAFLYIESGALMDSKLQWKKMSTYQENFVLSQDRTSIKVLISGLYSIGVVVNHFTAGNGSCGSILLQMDAKTLQLAASDSSYPTFRGYSSRQISCSLMCVVRVYEGANLGVVCANTSAIPNMPSYLTVARIGPWC